MDEILNIKFNVKIYQKYASRISFFKNNIRILADILLVILT
jgi:hypothetical protein